METNQWDEEKGKFGIGFILSIIFFGFSFCSTPIYNDSELLLEKKVFKSAEFHGGKINDVQISFLDNDDEYEINRIEKEYLNMELFKKIEYGDTIIISHVDDEIFGINFKKKNLMDKRKADVHKKQNRMFVRMISLTGILFFLIPVFCKEQPTIRFNGRQYLMKMNIYTMCLFLLILVIVAYFVGNPNPQL